MADQPTPPAGWPAFSPAVRQCLELFDEMTSDERGFLRHVLAVAGNTGPREKTTKKGDAPLAIRRRLSPSGGI